MWDIYYTSKFSLIVYGGWDIVVVSIRLPTILSWFMATLVGWIVVIVLDTWNTIGYLLSMGLNPSLSQCCHRFALFRSYIATDTHSLTGNIQIPGDQLSSRLFLWLGSLVAILVTWISNGHIHVSKTWLMLLGSMSLLTMPMYSSPRLRLWGPSPR